MNELEHQHIIREWGTSRYSEDKKWTKGSLKLGANFLLFEEADSEKGLVLSLDTITGLKMEKSWLVFNTLVIFVGPRSYWFSSFTCASPYVVLNTIEHFWREGLLVTTTENSGIPGSKVRTQLGREMLNEVYQAQVTLATAASDLFNQGEQLEEAMDGVERIDRDLGIAEANLSGMETWLGRWKVQPIKRTTSSAEENSKDASLEYPVMYACKPQDAQKPGFFSIQNKDIKILDSKRAEVLSFMPQEVTRITVPTPWELVITRRMIGQSDIYACITSAKLIYVLGALQPIYGRKIEFEDPQNHGHVEKPTRQQMQTAQQKLQGLISNATELSKNHLQRTSTLDKDKPIGPQLRTLQQSSKGVTDAEAEELSQVLKGLKSLATEIAPELERQDNLIGQLTQEVTDADDRINRDNRRMNRLL